jgi:transposase
MKPYSVDLRERILKDCDAGMGTLAVAVKYEVSLAWIRRLKQRRRETGQIAAQQPRPRQPVKLIQYVEKLDGLVREKPDATLEELRAQLGGNVSTTTLWRALRALKLTFKKKSCMLPSRIAPTCRRNARSGRRG